MIDFLCIATSGALWQYFATYWASCSDPVPPIMQLFLVLWFPRNLLSIRRSFNLLRTVCHHTCYIYCPGLWTQLLCVDPLFQGSDPAVFKLFPNMITAFSLLASICFSTWFPHFRVSRFPFFTKSSYSAWFCSVLFHFHFLYYAVLLSDAYQACMAEIFWTEMSWFPELVPGSISLFKACRSISCPAFFYICLAAYGSRSSFLDSVSLICPCFVVVLGKWGCLPFVISFCGNWRTFASSTS